MSRSANKVEELACRVLEPLGYEVLGAEFVKKSGELNLTVLIGKDAPITLDDCETAHNALDEPLDRLDPTGGEPYVLNVSSFGLDRPLKRDRDFERNIGGELEVALFTAIDGKKKYIGILRGSSPLSIALEVDGTQILIERKNLSKVVPHIRFDL